MSFEIQLTEQKVKRHQVTAMHLTCALAFIAGGAIMFTYNYVVPYWGLALLLAGVAILGATMVKNKWVIAPSNNIIFRIAELLIAASMATYSITQHWTFPIFIYSVLSGAVLFALLWERAADHGQFIHIDAEGIKLPVTSRKRFIDWVETDSVFVRYGTLSIECTDNRLFQWNIQNVTFDKDALEQFCNTMIEEHKSKRITDEW